MPRLLVAGCGDLGRRLADHMGQGSWAVTGLRRTPGELPGMETVAGDLNGRLDQPALKGYWDAAVFTATPDERSEAGYRRTYVQALSSLLDQVNIGRLIMVTSTAVYGQRRGEWVDENARTDPGAFNGRVLLEAETLAVGHPDCTVVRFSGIYGPGREYLLDSLKRGSARCRPEPPQWTNRIHSADCAGFLAHLVEMSDPPGLVCATDSLPAPRCQVLDWLADRLGLEAPLRDEAGPDPDQGKRVSNARMLATGYVLQYPDFRTGYGELAR